MKHIPSKTDIVEPVEPIFCVPCKLEKGEDPVQVGQALVEKDPRYALIRYYICALGDRHKVSLSDERVKALVG